MFEKTFKYCGPNKPMLQEKCVLAAVNFMLGSASAHVERSLKTFFVNTYGTVRLISPVSKIKKPTQSSANLWLWSYLKSLNTFTLAAEFNCLRTQRLYTEEAIVYRILYERIP